MPSSGRCPPAARVQHPLRRRVPGPIGVARGRPGDIGDDVLLEFARVDPDDPTGASRAMPGVTSAPSRPTPTESGRPAPRPCGRVPHRAAEPGTRASRAPPPDGWRQGTVGRRRRRPRTHVRGTRAVSPRAPTAASPSVRAEAMRWKRAKRTASWSWSSAPSISTSASSHRGGPRPRDAPQETLEAELPHIQ